MTVYKSDNGIYRLDLQSVFGESQYFTVVWAFPLKNVKKIILINCDCVMDFHFNYKIFEFKRKTTLTTTLNVEKARGKFLMKI